MAARAIPRIFSHPVALICARFVRRIGRVECQGTKPQARGAFATEGQRAQAALPSSLFNNHDLICPGFYNPELPHVSRLHHSGL